MTGEAKRYLLNQGPNFNKMIIIEVPAPASPLQNADKSYTNLTLLEILNEPDGLWRCPTISPTPTRVKSKLRLQLEK